jgi:hypothetical protein
LPKPRANSTTTPVYLLQVRPPSISFVIVTVISYFVFPSTFLIFITCWHHPIHYKVETVQDPALIKNIVSFATASFNFISLQNILQYICNFLSKLYQLETWSFDPWIHCFCQWIITSNFWFNGSLPVSIQIQISGKTELQCVVNKHRNSLISADSGLQLARKSLGHCLTLL